MLSNWRSPPRVLLVDANLSSSSLHSALRVGMDNGLTDLLLGRCTLSEAIRETGVPNLLVIRECLE